MVERPGLRFHSLAIVDGWRVRILLAAAAHIPTSLSNACDGDTRPCGRVRRQHHDQSGSKAPDANGQFLPETVPLHRGNHGQSALLAGTYSRSVRALFCFFLQAAWTDAESDLPCALPIDRC